MKLFWKHVIQHNRRNKLFHKCVSTWTPLATTFNHRPSQKFNFSLMREDSGLFRKPELVGFEGFYSWKEAVIRKSDDLVEEAISSNKKRPMVEIFDELSDTLCKIADLAEFIRIAHPKTRFRNAAEDACISISGIVEKLNTDRALYDALLNSVKNGTSGDKHVAHLFLFDFEQSGIHLDEKPRERVVLLNDCILQTGQRFMASATSVRHVPKEIVPPHIRQHFGNNSELVVTGLHVDSNEPHAREIAYRLYLAPDPVQDIALLNLLSGRQEMAQLCGFPTYADRAIKASTMESTSNVLEFLDVLSGNLRDRAQKDFDQMLRMKQKEVPSADKLECWDTPYFLLKAKQNWLKVASSEYSPYFSLGGCMEGFNLLLQSLYGISLQHEEMLIGESWSPDVYKLAVIHETEGLLGHIYCDFYERPNKPNQDCHFTIQGGKQLPDGTYQNPIVVVMLSLSYGNWGGPALLSPGSVDNLFHELGHAMHSMLGRAKYQHVSGTRCPTDLAEVPSVLMEYFAGNPQVLRLFAKHFQTNEPMPEGMLHRLCAAKHVFSASEMQQQVFYSVLDQKYHGKNPPSDKISSTDILKEIQSQYYNLPYVENTAWQHRFSHLVGYGAKYYSYLISRAVAWSSWRKTFIENPLSRGGGEWLRSKLLRHGGSLPCLPLVTDLLSPMEITPTSLANALTEELDYHTDYLNTIRKIENKHCN